jgi:ATP-dependent DNA ligase
MSKLFPVLYRKNSKNKVYFWQISVKKDGDLVFIVSEHGTDGGKVVTHSKEIKKGRGKRNKYEQALFNAESKWNDKVNKEAYITDKTKLDSNIVVRPMLAHKFEISSLTKKRGIHIKLPAFAQPKYDGIRCLSNLVNENVVLQSRTGTLFNNLNKIRTDLKKILSKLPDSFFFDGELYTDELPFEVISGAVRLDETNEKEALSNINKIKYCIYDCFDTNNLDIPFTERIKLIKKYVKGTNLIISPTVLITKQSEIKPLHDSYVSDGFEGLMLRNTNSPYEIRKRSKHLQKYKEFKEEEFKITGFKEGQGIAKGTVIWECITKEKKPFSVRPRGSNELKKKWFENGDKYVGKKLTVIFQEYSKDGIPRFPVGKAVRDNY